MKVGDLVRLSKRHPKREYGNFVNTGIITKELGHHCYEVIFSCGNYGFLCSRELEMVIRK